MYRTKRRSLGFRAVTVIMVMATLLCVFSGFSFTVAAGSVSDKQQELAQLQKEQKEIEASIKNLGDSIDDQKKKVNQLYLKVDNLEAQVEAYESQIATVDQTISLQNERIATLTKEIAIKQQVIDEVLGKLKKRVKAITKTGNYSPLQLLSNTDNYEDFLLKSQVLKCVSAHDNDLCAQAESEKKAILDKKTAVESQKAESEVAKAELEKLKTDLETQFEELSSLYTQAYDAKVALEKKLGTYKNEQKKLEQAEKLLEQEINALLGNPSSEKYGGKMYWPVPAVKQISCTFGQKPTYFHGGTDIWGPDILKKNIVAAADGVVLRADTYQHYSYGYFVMVDHGYDSKGRRIVTLYAHMYQKPSVKAGDKVKGGTTVLGLVGSTGNSTGPHLHFEVRVDGTRVDPIGKGYIAQPK